MASSYKHHIISDFAVLILMGIFLAMIHFGVLGKGHQGFFLDDRSISFPHVSSETVPMGQATIWVIGGPVVMILFFAVVVDRVLSKSWSNQTSEVFPTHPYDIGGVVVGKPDQYWSNFNTPPPSNHALVPESSIQHIAQSQLPPLSTRVSWGTANIPGQSPFIRKVRYVIYQLYVFAFCLTLTMLITNTLKQIVSRMRPDFISWCQPDPKASGWVSPDLVADVCLGNKTDILEGQKSFPSGHSSSTMVSSMFIIIYLFKRAWNRGRRAFGAAFIPAFMTFSLIVTLGIAASRNLDHRHHATDIITGLLIGFGCALVSLAFDPFTPSWEYDGTCDLKQYMYEGTEPVDSAESQSLQHQPLTSDVV